MEIGQNQGRLLAFRAGGGNENWTYLSMIEEGRVTVDNDCLNIKDKRKISMTIH